MIQLLIQMGQLAMAAFSQKKSVRQIAGFVACCLLLSLAFAVLTTWISYPAYFQMATNPDPQKVWIIAGGVAALMFYATSSIGVHIAEKSQGVEPTLTGQTVGFVVMIALGIGAFDAYKGFQVGADERSRDVHRVLSFEEATVGQQKPYQAEIDQLTNEIDRLYSEEQKVKYQGKWTTPYKNILQAEENTEKRNKLIDAQVAAVDEQRALHAQRSAHTRTRQKSAKGTLQVLSLILYFLQILLAIPLGIFAVMWDMSDGERDGKNRNHQGGFLGRIWGPKKQAITAQTPIGYPTKRSGTNPEESYWEDSGSGTGSGSGSGTGSGTGSHTHSKDIRIDNQHPPFSSRNQPSDYQGIDQKLYNKVVAKAKIVHGQRGRYHREEIAQRAGTTPKTVLKHLKVAWELGDLPK